MSDEAKKAAREWLSHAHGEDGCPHDDADPNTGAENCLADLLDSFAAEGIATARLNTLHNIHGEDCEVFTQAKALTCKCLQRRVSDAEAQLEKLKAERLGGGSRPPDF